jgi:CheY-like chemotaxis protein
METRPRNLATLSFSPLLTTNLVLPIMKAHPLLTLIADDSEDDRLLFSRAVQSSPGLRLAGITSDGVETVAYLNGCAPYGNRVKFPYPDLILLDCQMPGYNGIEVMAFLTPNQRRPKIILWSSTIESIDQSLAYKLGATVVCSKPMMAQDVQGLLMSMQPGNSPRMSASVVVSPRARCRLLSTSPRAHAGKVLRK